MKTILKSIAMICLLIVPFKTMAQDEGQSKQNAEENLSAEERASKRTDKMKTELNLTEAQTKSIYDINLAHILVMDKYREEQKALREKMKVEKEATRTKIKTVLTPEQNAIFDQKGEEHKQKQEEHHKNSVH